MGLFNVVGRATMAAGQPEDVTQILANLDAIATVLNGGIDNSNVNAAAAILLSKLAGYPADGTKFAAGDGTWKVPGSGAVSLIFDTTLGAPQASIDSNTILGGVLPVGYKHLKLVMQARSTGAGSGEYVAIQFNGDAGANYERQSLFADAPASVTTSGSSGDTRIISGVVAGGGAAANFGGILSADIINYQGVTFYKQVMGQISQFNTAVNNSEETLFHGAWLNTAAITRITVFPHSGVNWAAGSRFTLYGLS